MLLVFFVARWSGSAWGVFFVFNAAVTIAFGFMIILVIWHRGFIRAYAIGVLSAIVLNSLYSLVGFNAMFSRNSGSWLLPVFLVTIVSCGLVCGGYVYLLESARSRTGDRGVERTSDGTSAPDGAA
jgi:hypothetical protein